jgi:hypothetical protein
MAILSPTEMEPLVVFLWKADDREEAFKAFGECIFINDNFSHSWIF